LVSLRFTFLRRRLAGSMAGSRPEPSLRFSATSSTCFGRIGIRPAEMAPRTLLLLPGLLCDEEIWRPQREALGGDYDIRLPRFAGFNRITAMAEHVLSRAPTQFALAGHSMGGRVALEIHRLAPERIGLLMLLDTGVAPIRVGEAQERGVLVELAR